MRCLSAAAVLGCVALLAGCGSGHSRHTTMSAQQNQVHLGRVYAVNVFFCSKIVCPTNATRSEERLVGERLRQEACVRRVAFTTKAQALAKFKKEHPKLVAAMPPGLGNPLPDSYEVTPDKPSCAPAIAAAARAAHWPGVQQVGLERRPATRAGS